MLEIGTSLALILFGSRPKSNELLRGNPYIIAIFRIIHDRDWDFSLAQILFGSRSKIDSAGVSTQDIGAQEYNTIIRRLHLSAYHRPGMENRTEASRLDQSCELFVGRAKINPKSVLL